MIGFFAFEQQLTLRAALVIHYPVVVYSLMAYINPHLLGNLALNTRFGCKGAYSIGNCQRLIIDIMITWKKLRIIKNQ